MTQAQGGPSAETGAPAGDLPPGFVVGEYHVERVLGRGGMGAVYAARQPAIDARVAIKVLAADLSREPRLVKRFVDEARAVNKIRHPNIIDIFAFGQLPDGRCYFVMEHLDGETLADRLARGPLTAAQARPLLLQICEALEAAHQERIVHRDLKPENLWIATPRHGQPYAKILDFGIAKLVEPREASMITDEGVAMGTPYFMSPEQCRGEAVDHRTDIYAMGVLLYLVFGGRLPFEGTSFLGVVTQQITATPVPPSSYRPVPPRLEALILGCLAKDPARRPASARALGHELANVLGDALPAETLPPAAAAPVVPALATGPAPVSARPRRRGPLLALVALTVAAAAAGIFLATRARGPAATQAEPSSSAAPPPPVEAAASPATAPVPREGLAPSSPAGAPATPSPPRERPREARRNPARPPAPPPAGKPGVEERGFLKENPFR